MNAYHAYQRMVLLLVLGSVLLLHALMGTASASPGVIALAPVVVGRGGVCIGSFDTSQHDVHGCIEITGSLAVYSNLPGPLSLRMLEGSLLVQSNQVTTLRGLEHLMTIGDNLEVLFTQLRDFTGLESLSVVTGNVDLQENKLLASLHGLHNLRYVGDSLYTQGLVGNFGACGSLSSSPEVSRLSVKSSPEGVAGRQQTSSSTVFHRCYFENHTTCRSTHQHPKDMRTRKNVAYTASSHGTTSYACVPTLMTRIQARPDLSILYKAILVTGMDAALQSDAVNLTYLAPSNDAFRLVFAHLGISQNDFVMLEATPKILLYHAVTGQHGETPKPLHIADLQAFAEKRKGANLMLDTLYRGEHLRLEVTTAASSSSGLRGGDAAPPLLRFNGHALALAAEADQRNVAGNGLLYVIQGVLLPPSRGATAS